MYSASNDVRGSHLGPLTLWFLRKLKNVRIGIQIVSSVSTALGSELKTYCKCERVHVHFLMKSRLKIITRCECRY